LQIAPKAFSQGAEAAFLVYNMKCLLKHIYATSDGSRNCPFSFSCFEV
jgi:hypothetical protein